MIVCKEYEARISALIDDELTAEERIEVMEHLARCPVCKAYWDDLLAMRDILRTQEQSVPAGFTDAVMARVRQTKQDTVRERKTLRFPRWKRFAALAACCAVVMLGIWSMDWMPNLESSMDMAATNNCPAPERSAAQGDAMTGSVWDNGCTNDSAQESEDYSVSPDGTAATYEAPDEAPDASPESNAESDSVKTFAQNGDFAAAVVTASEVAGQWVEETLNVAWVSGASYTLSEEQYLKLCDLLRLEGEQFTEIMGNHADGGYCLLAE